MDKEEQESLEIDIKYKIADVFRYNLYVAYQSIVSKLMVVVGLLLIGALCYRFYNRITTLDVFISQNIIFIILPIFILIATPWKVWTITALQMQTPAFSQGAAYIFYVDKIHMEAGTLSDDVPWETYSRIVETKKDFRFFVDKVQAQIIPKHNMTTSQQNHLKDLIKKANPESIYKLKV